MQTQRLFNGAIVVTLPSHKCLFRFFCSYPQVVCEVWYRLPYLPAVPTLIGLRVNMRRDNMFSTERDPSLLKLGGKTATRSAHGAAATAISAALGWGCPARGLAGMRQSLTPMARCRPISTRPTRASSATRLLAREVIGPPLERTGSGMAAVHGS